MALSAISVPQLRHNMTGDDMAERRQQTYSRRIFNLRRASTPARPVPSRIRDAGSGVGATAGSAKARLKLKDVELPPTPVWKPEELAPMPNRYLPGSNRPLISRSRVSLAKKLNAGTAPRSEGK